MTFGRMQFRHPQTSFCPSINGIIALFQVGSGPTATQVTAGGSFEQGKLRPFVAGGVGHEVDANGNIVPAAQSGFSFNEHGEAQGIVGGNVGLTGGLNLGRPFQG